MNKIALVTFVSVVAVSCGTWSNEDLQYLSALPTKDQLTTKLPTATAGGLSGEGTRRDALGLGEPSQLYKDTKGASNDFNGIVDGFISVIDFVRSFPPSTRTDNSRIWGPYEDKQNQPGFELQVVITRVDPKNFAIQIQYRKTGTEAFTDVITGGFTASSTAKKGQGALTWDLKGARALGLKGDETAKTLEKLELGYITDMFPIQVNMVFTLIPGQAVSKLDYGYLELANKSGRIGFRTLQADPNVTQLDTVSQWLASGAGNGVYTVVEGNYKGATHVECWDAAFKTVFVNETWPGGAKLGDPKDCVTVDGFPLP